MKYKRRVSLKRGHFLILPRRQFISPAVTGHYVRESKIYHTRYAKGRWLFLNNCFFRKNIYCIHKASFAHDRIKNDNTVLPVFPQFSDWCYIQLPMVYQFRVTYIMYQRKRIRVAWYILAISKTLSSGSVVGKKQNNLKQNKVTTLVLPYFAGRLLSLARGRREKTTPQ